MADSSDEGFQNGSINFEENPAVYYSGQTVNGSVKFVIRQPLNFTALQILYLGEAKVLWSEFETETFNGVKRVKEVKYRAREEYFNYGETLAGGSGITKLPPGHHSIPFKYQIPFQTPSSFESDKATISYTVTATIIYPDSRAEEMTKEVTVISPLDLNTGNPKIREKIKMEMEGEYSCGCFSFCQGDNNKQIVRVLIPEAGYCPGQTIPIAVEVLNNSNFEINQIKFELVKRELYRSQQPVSVNVLPEQVLVAVKKGAIFKQSKKRFIQDIIVPDMIPPYLEHCSLIDIGYFIKVTVKLPGCSDNLHEEAEICLGLEPIKERLETEYIHPLAHSLPKGPIPIPKGLILPSSSQLGFNNAISRSLTNLPQNNSPYLNVPSHSGLSYRSQPNINRGHQNMGPPYSDLPPPYPGLPQNPSQPAYNIGFKPPYPGGPANVSTAPYPTNPIPAFNNPYPTNSGVPQGSTNGDFSHIELVPSAPPAPQ